MKRNYFKLLFFSYLILTTYFISALTQKAQYLQDSACVRAKCSPRCIFPHLPGESVLDKSYLRAEKF